MTYSLLGKEGEGRCARRARLWRPPDWPEAVFSGNILRLECLFRMGLRRGAVPSVVDVGTLPRVRGD